MIFRKYLRLCTVILEFTLELSKIQENSSWETVEEGCGTSHRLKWGSLPLNVLGRIAQHVMKREGMKEGKDILHIFIIKFLERCRGYKSVWTGIPREQQEVKSRFLPFAKI